MRWIAIGVGVAVALIVLQVLDVNWHEWLNFQMFVLVPIALVVAVGCFIVETRRRRTRDTDPS